MHRKPLLQVIWFRHSRLLASLAGLLVVNILLLSFLYFAVAPQLDEKEKDLAALQQQQRRNDTIAPQQIYEQGKKDLESFRQSLPSLNNFSALIGELYTLAEGCHLEISQISYGQKELPENGILSYALRFSLTGSYDQLKRFIYGLEESQRLIVIDQMTLNSAKGEFDELLVTLNLNFTTYFGTEGQE